MDNSIDFLRNWTDYRDGFGDPSGNIWLGMFLFIGLEIEETAFMGSSVSIKGV